MSRRTPDRPLTDAEERALADLARRRDRFHAGTLEERWSWAKPCRSSTTLYALHDRGLVETRLRFGTLEPEARITDAGYALVNGMGD